MGRSRQVTRFSDLSEIGDEVIPKSRKQSGQEFSDNRQDLEEFDSRKGVKELSSVGGNKCRQGVCGFSSPCSAAGKRQMKSIGVGSPGWKSSKRKR